MYFWLIDLIKVYCAAIFHLIAIHSTCFMNLRVVVCTVLIQHFPHLTFCVWDCAMYYFIFVMFLQKSTSTGVELRLTACSVGGIGMDMGMDVSMCIGGVCSTGYSLLRPSSSTAVRWYCMAEGVARWYSPLS